MAKKLIARNRLARLACLVPMAVCLSACSALTSALGLFDDGKDDEINNCALEIAGNGDVRAFAVGLDFQIDADFDLESVRAPALQAASRLAECQRRDGRNLVVLPGDLSDFAQFLGPRGQNARTAASLSEARSRLQAEYKSVMDLYRAQFGSAIVSDQHALELALGNVNWLTTDIIVGEFAALSGMLTVASIVAPTNTRATSDATEIADFGDELAFPGQAIVAESPTVQRQLVIYAPNGDRIGTIPAAHATLDDRNRGLTPRKFAELRPMELLSNSPGVAPIRIAPLPGNDIDRLDLRRRLADLGGGLIVQPTSYPGWTYNPINDLWIPDLARSGAWASVQHLPQILAGLTATLSGNLPGAALDGQSHITRKVDSGQPPMAFVGNIAERGYADIGEWTFPDPADSNAAITDDARRDVLTELGIQLGPGSEAPNEGSYTAGLAAAEVRLPQSGAYPFNTPGGVTAHTVRPSVAVLGDNQVLVAWTAQLGTTATVRWGTLEQGAIIDQGEIATVQTAARNIRLVNAGQLLVAVWEQGGPGLERIRYATFSTQSSQWSPPTIIDNTGGPQLWPDVAGFNDGDETKLAFTWTDYRFGVGAVAAVTGALSASTETSNFFFQPQWLSANTESTLADPAGAYFSRVAMLPDGNQLYCWISDIEFPGSVSVATSDIDEGGKIFQETWPITEEPEQYPNVTGVDCGIDDQFNAWLAWTGQRPGDANTRIQASVIGFDTDFEPLDIPLSNRLDRSVAAPEIESQGDRIWIAWQSVDDATVRSWYVRGTAIDGFAEPTRLDGGGQSVTHAWTPAIGSSPSGAIGVWEDASNGFGRIGFNLSLVP